jgi:hypothetical protein
MLLAKFGCFILIVCNVALYDSSAPSISSEQCIQDGRPQPDLSEVEKAARQAKLVALFCRCLGLHFVAHAFHSLKNPQQIASKNLVNLGCVVAALDQRLRNLRQIGS